MQGLALAIAIGVAAGVLLGASRTLHDASSVVLEFLRPIPGVALIPLAILAFGLDTPMRRFVIAYAAVWPVLIATIYGVNGRDRMLDDVARTSGVGRRGHARARHAARRAAEHRRGHPAQRVGRAARGGDGRVRRRARRDRRLHAAAAARLPDPGAVRRGAPRRRCSATPSTSGCASPSGASSSGRRRSARARRERAQAARPGRPRSRRSRSGRSGRAPRRRSSFRRRAPSPSGRGTSGRRESSSRTCRRA